MSPGENANFRGSETDSVSAVKKKLPAGEWGKEQAETKNVRSPERKKNTDTI